MSIPNLPVDFKDDILNTGVNQKRKYQQTYNADGSVSFEDVTAYQQKGSNFGAQEVNETNGAVNNIYSERILDLDELELVTEPGFFVDAQAVKEAHDSLNSKIPDVYYEEVALHYYNGSYMTGTVNVGKQFAGRPVQVTLIYKDGYPIAQTWNVSATMVDTSGNTTIWAVGSNYISAHVMSVLVRCETDPT